MGIDEIRLFQQEIGLLQDKFHDLSKIYTPPESLPQDETTSLVMAEESLSEQGAWLKALPADIAIWNYAHIRWFGSYRIGVSLAYITNTLKIHLNEPVEETVSAILNELIERLRVLGRSILETFSSQTFVSYSYASPLLLLKPRVIADILWIWLFPGIIKQPCNVLVTDDNVRVLYHPYCTISLLHTIAGQLFSGEELITVTLTQESRFLRVEIRSQPLHLTPNFWQRLIGQLSNDLERLREIGGEIEPLTWDDGQGEGVIVRLPWAKPEEHDDNRLD